MTNSPNKQIEGNYTSDEHLHILYSIQYKNKCCLFIESVFYLY